MPPRNIREIRSYIANLQVDTEPLEQTRAAPATLGPLPATETKVSLDNLPNGLVNGTQLIEFSSKISPELKSSILMSLLAAQRVATNDKSITDPDQWVQKHNEVLANLNWAITEQSEISFSSEHLSGAVHKAVIPFLTEVMGSALGAGSLILAAIKQLETAGENQPWITLFDQQSRRYSVTEHQFALVEPSEGVTRIHLASARFDARYGLTQVLFFKVENQKVNFDGAKATLAADSAQLEALNQDLRNKLTNAVREYVTSLPDDLIL